MRTLLPPSYHWPVLILAAILLRAAFLDISWVSFFVVLICIYQFSLLFQSIGYIIPTRHLLGSFMCVQFFVGPVLAYNGLDQYQYIMYTMRVEEDQYFAYAIPAVLLFIIGVHTNAGKYRGEVVNQNGIRTFVDRNPKVAYIFIITGFLASLVSAFFPSALALVFYLLGSFKFVGLFLLILGSRQLKLLPLIIVIGSIISSSLVTGMFHDLLTWLIFSAAVFAIKYKFGFKIKMIGLLSFIFMVVTIQLLKGGYRDAISQDEKGGSAETFANLYKEKNEEGGLFNFNSLASSNVRINQGFIITNIMVTVPHKVPYAEGKQMYDIMEAAILPRFLAPNKLRAGDRTVFKKYSGIGIREGTSMGLSSLGDAYVNWGLTGGVIFMFFLGLFYSYVLNQFHKLSRFYPVLILFTTIVFYYPIRPDCELQTILGHLIKACFVIFIIIVLQKDVFWVRPILRRKANADGSSLGETKLSVS